MPVKYNSHKIGSISQTAAQLRKQDWTPATFAAAIKLPPELLTQALAELDLRLEIKRPVHLPEMRNARVIWLRGRIKVKAPKGRFVDGKWESSVKEHRLLNVPLGFAADSIKSPLQATALYIAASRWLVELQAARWDLDKFVEVLNRPLQVE